MREYIPPRDQCDNGACMNAAVANGSDGEYCSEGCMKAAEHYGTTDGGESS